VSLGFNALANKFCEPYMSKGAGLSSLKHAFKELMKTEFTQRTWGHAVKELMIRYNVSEQEAKAILLYAMRKAMENEREYMGGRYRYWRQQIEGELENYITYIDEDLKLDLDLWSEKVKSVRGFKQKLKLMLLEACAYLHLNKRLTIEKLKDFVLRADSIIAEKIVEPVLSKQATWILASVLVFDVLDSVHAGDEHASLKYVVEEDAIKISYKPFYQRVGYISKKESFAWKVYDDFIEEVGRELVAMSLHEFAFRLASRSLKYIAKAVVTLALFHPAFRAGLTVARCANAVAEILQGSFLLRLASQPFLEWKLEGWLASHEWSILRRFRDKLAMVFQLDEYVQYYDKVRKLKEFYEWVQKYTEAISLEDLPPNARYTRKVKELGYRELPSAMQKLVEEYTEFCKKKSVSDILESVLEDNSYVLNEGSWGYVGKTSTLDYYFLFLKGCNEITDKQFGEWTVECENGIVRRFKGTGAFKNVESSYDLKFLRKDVSLKTCIYPQA